MNTRGRDTRPTFAVGVVPDTWETWGLVPVTTLLFILSHKKDPRRGLILFVVV